MRVLVVEDEIRMADMLRRGLGRGGMTVDVTGLGADAMWMAGSTPYEAIVLDVGLPGHGWLRGLSRGCAPTASGRRS